jgi:hypothetical protein
VFPSSSSSSSSPSSASASAASSPSAMDAPAAPRPSMPAPVGGSMRAHRTASTLPQRRFTLLGSYGRTDEPHRTVIAADREANRLHSFLANECVPLPPAPPPLARAPLMLLLLRWPCLQHQDHQVHVVLHLAQEPVRTVRAACAGGDRVVTPPPSSSPNGSSVVGPGSTAWPTCTSSSSSFSTGCPWFRPLPRQVLQPPLGRMGQHTRP